MPEQTTGAEVDLAALTIPQLAAAARGLGPALEAKVRATAQEIRDARVGRVLPADTWPLVRSLTWAAEILTDCARGFAAGAAAAHAEIAEDLIAVHGEQDGIPQGRLVVPDEGTEIVTGPSFSSGGRSWDWETLGETLVSIVKRDEADGAQGPVTASVYDEGVEAGARAMLRRLAEIGAVKDPAVSKVDALARVLGAQGRDRLARALQAASVPLLRKYVGVTVAREQPKTRRRS